MKKKKLEKYFCPFHGVHKYWLTYQDGFGPDGEIVVICGPCYRYRMAIEARNSVVHLPNGEINQAENK